MPTATVSPYDAVKYVLDRVQDSPDVRYYCGWGTEIFYRLIQAEAAHLGKPLEDVERERRKDLQPHYRRRQAEAVTLREERDALRQICEENGINWAAETEVIR